MTYTATLKYATQSHKKLNLIAKLVRWKSATESRNMLQLMPHKAAKTLDKLLNSAIANAKQENIDPSTLHIQHIYIWRWPKLKRMRFVAKARVYGYVKHRAYAKVILATA